MTFDQYQSLSMETRLPTACSGYVVLGMVGELGELYGKWAKLIRDGGERDQEDTKKELGDILWFLAALCEDNGLSLDDVAKYNIYKLQSRKARNTLQGSGDNR